MDRYRDTLLLLIAVTEGSEVLSGLSRSHEQGTGSFLPTRHLDYHTQVFDAKSVKTMMAKAQRPALDLASMARTALGQGERFVVPLRKRAGADQISLDRISVGRATNKDIVLRDATVSKFHAWFELSDGLDFSLFDSGSTNKTTVNGVDLAPRQRQALFEGDELSFGAVPALVCSAETLWLAVHT